MNLKGGTGGSSALSASPACSGELERQSPRAVTHPRPVFLLGLLLFPVLSAPLRSPCAPWRWEEAAGRSPRACWPWLGVDGWRTTWQPCLQVTETPIVVGPRPSLDSTWVCSVFTPSSRAVGVRPGLFGHGSLGPKGHLVAESVWGYFVRRRPRHFNS